VCVCGGGGGGGGELMRNTDEGCEGASAITGMGE
jgi:hypothetical protein